MQLKHLTATSYETPQYFQPIIDRTKSFPTCKDTAEQIGKLNLPLPTEEFNSLSFLSSKEKLFIEENSLLSQIQLEEPFTTQDDFDQKSSNEKKRKRELAADSNSTADPTVLKKSKTTSELFCRICGTLKSKKGWKKGPGRIQLCYKDGTDYYNWSRRVPDQDVVDEAYAPRFPRHPRAMTKEEIAKIKALPLPRSFLITRKASLDPSRFCRICGASGKKANTYGKGPGGIELCSRHAIYYLKQCKLVGIKFDQKTVDKAFAARYTKHPNDMSKKEIAAVKALPPPCYFFTAKKKRLDPNRFCRYCGVLGEATTEWRKGPGGIEFCKKDGTRYSNWCQKVREKRISQKAVDEAFTARFLRHPREMTKKEIAKIKDRPFTLSLKK